MEYLSHIRRDEQRRQDVGQTTRDHLLGVMEYAGRFAVGMHLEHMARLIGALHDMGKMCRVFVDYLWDSYQHPENRFQHERIDHSAVGAQYLWEQYGRHGTDAEQLTCEWAAMVIMSHHAGLYDYLDGSGESPFSGRLDKSLVHYEESTNNFFAEVLDRKQLDELFHAAVREVETLCRRIDKVTGNNDKVFHFYRGMAIKFLFSILVDSDRLQTANFMYNTDLEKQWAVDNLWDDFSEKLECKLQSFSQPANLQQKKIMDARRGISESCLSSAKRQPGIFTLSVPTGSGKTLASMRFALAHAKKYNKKRILVVIPYTSIIDQNADEIRKVFQRKASDEVILEHHSNVLPDSDWKEQATGTGRAIWDEEGDYSEKAEHRRAMAERWDVPIIFTTQVQFLNTLFDGRAKSLRRLHSLEDSVIIFDEIQTLPVRCTYLFNEAMNFLKDFAGVTAVLCTATQPELSDLQVPLRKAADAEMVADLNEVFDAFQRVRINNICVPGGQTSDAMAEVIWRDAVKHGNVLCIVNTTASARRIYRSLLVYRKQQDEDMTLIHLSTKLCPAHRKKLLKQIRDNLDGSVKIICISTQLIEAGVDVSFAVVYRALAGFSSIAQAAGRCNRHGEMPCGIVKIFNLEHEKLDKLEDIRRGMDVAVRMLGNYPADKILTPPVMQTYFQRYYQECRQSMLAYPTKTRGTLYDWLSDNEMGYNAQEEKGIECNLIDYQAFRSAGREFYVIDQCTVSVVVPYGKGKALIDSLEDKTETGAAVFQKQKELQQYMVNLFSYEVRALCEKKMIRETPIGIPVLLQDAYDEALGVVLDKEFDELLCI